MDKKKFSLIDLIADNKLIHTLLAIVIGFIVSFFAIYYRRRVIGSFVRAIRRAEAFDKESAKTLAELEQEDNISAIETIRKSASIRRLITVYNEGDEDENGKDRVKIDENTRFYITEECETRSRVQYGNENEPLWPLILGSLAMIGIGIISFFKLLFKLVLFGFFFLPPTSVIVVVPCQLNYSLRLLIRSLHALNLADQLLILLDRDRDIIKWIDSCVLLLFYLDFSDIIFHSFFLLLHNL